MSNRNPFTVFEAKVRLYLLNAQGQLLNGSVYFGGCVESISFEQTLTTRRLEYPGLRFAKEHHDDEEHLIELHNPWLHDASVAPARMPKGHERNQRYVMVIVWQDDEAGIWTKRTYSGVTSRGQKVEEIYQDLRFRAESLVENCGLLADGDPSLMPSVAGVVRYVSEDGWIDLYTYDGDTAVLTAIDEELLDGRAAIVADATSLVISFAGVPVLDSTASVTEVAEIVATGQSFLDELPRLEFFLDESRIASLGASGILVVVNLAEAGDPNVPDDFEFRDTGGDWLFSLALPKSRFPSITEVAP